MDIGQYEDYFVKHLSGLGYDGVYWPKSRYKTMNDADRRLVDGCATFYKSDKCVSSLFLSFSDVTDVVQIPTG